MIDMSKIVGSSSDGASNLTGKHNGLFTLFRNETGSLVHNHCAAHKVNLVASDCFSSEEVFQTIDTAIKDLHNYYNNHKSKLSL